MSTATDMLALYLAAETAVLKGQTFRLGDKQVTFADLSMIQSGRREWELKVRGETDIARGRTPGVALADFNQRCGLEGSRE
jgi:hypothetical protein